MLRRGLASFARAALPLSPPAALSPGTLPLAKHRKTFVCMSGRGEPGSGHQIRHRYKI